MKHILVDPGNAASLVYLPPLIRLGYKLDNLLYLGRVLVGFNGMLTHSPREIVLPISVGLITALVPLMMINESSNFNAKLGRT